MKKVSVIVPVCNGELYIVQCIQSVVNQTYHNLEIIIIENGSEDRSLDICKELSQADDRILLIKQTEANVSRARNRGLAAATGEYIFFLDCDDMISLFLIEKFVCQAEKQHAEIIMCNCRKVNSSQMVQLRGEAAEEEEKLWITGSREQSEEWFHIKYPKEMSSIGGKMFCRKCIGELRFDENLSYGEDTLFVYRVVCKHVKIVYIPLGWYYYRQHKRKEDALFEMIKNEGEGYFESTRIIRDSEYQKRHFYFALYWEKWLIKQLKISYLLMKDVKDKQNCRVLRKMALTETSQPMFRKLRINRRILFWCCFFCQPVYKGILLYFNIKEKLLKGFCSKYARKKYII